VLTEPGFGVVWPGGRSMASGVLPTAALGDLSGKTIAFVWNDLFRGDEIFAMVREKVSARFEDVRFVGPREFGNITGPDEQGVAERLPDALLQYRVDAAITGVGA
jgi:hypothetical protein